MNQITDADELLIRPAHPNDAQALNAIAAHPQVARTLVQLPSKELAQTESRLQECKPGFHRFIAEKNGFVAGAVTLTQQQNPRRAHSGNLGLMVHPEFWRQRTGTALMAAIIDLADNWLNLKRVELSVFPDNSVAIHLYQKFGFKPEGTRRIAVFADGRFQDQLIMSRLSPDSPQVIPITPPQFPTRQDVASVQVRPTKISDTADIHKILIHPGVGYGTNQIPSQELSVTAEWLQHQIPGRFRYSAIAQHENDSFKVVGNLNLHQPQNPRLVHSASFGMSVHPHYWGLGIGARLLETALDLTDNWLGLKRVELEVHSDNPAAIHLYEKYGFILEGTKRLYSFGAGRWANTHFMARISNNTQTVTVKRDLHAGQYANNK